MAYSLTYSYDLSSQSYSVTGYSGITTSDKVIIPDKYDDGTNGEHPVKSIGDGAFEQCGLVDIAIPDSVTNIGISAFAGCSNLTSVVIPNSVTNISDATFKSCESLTSVTIGNGVTSIGIGSFYGCSSLTSITIPDGVTSIGDGAFEGCSSLTSITIPDGVTSISDGAFEGCSSLTSITIPDSVTSIGDVAFEGCSSLRQLILFPSTPPTLGSWAIPTTISAIYVPQSSKEAYKTATNWASFADKIVSDNLYLSFIRFNQKNKDYIDKKIQNNDIASLNVVDGTAADNQVELQITKQDAGTIDGPAIVGKDGITINKAADSEKIEISGKGCVQNSSKQGYVVYTRENNVNKSRTFATQPVPNSFPIWNINNELEGNISDSSTDNILTNKKYVDDNYVKKVKFTNLEQALYGYILDTTKEAYADLDSAVLKNSVAVGDNVYPIADKTRALVTQIEGKTTKMVQLLDKSKFSATTTINGVTFTNNGDGTITANGTATNASDLLLNNDEVPTIKNHIYCVLGSPFGGSPTTYSTSTTWGSEDGNGIIQKNIRDLHSGNYWIHIESGYTANNLVFIPQLFDLTAMNREDITTAEQFKAEFPEFYPYENGNIYPAKISGVKFYEKQDKSGEQGSVTLPETYDLHGIGDYKDYLEITKNDDNELYTLKKIQAIDKHVFDGTETWVVSGRVLTICQAFYTAVVQCLFTNDGKGGLSNNLPLGVWTDDKEHIQFGQANKVIYVFLNKEKFKTGSDVQEYLAAQYASGNPLIAYYILPTPIETVIATNLTYEQVTAIRHNGGLIEVDGNTNKGYARPTVTNTIVYRLTAANTAEG